jgi:hypothetical protein
VRAAIPCTNMRRRKMWDSAIVVSSKVPVHQF